MRKDVWAMSVTLMMPPGAHLDRGRDHLGHVAGSRREEDLDPCCRGHEERREESHHGIAAVHGACGALRP